MFRFQPVSSVSLLRALPAARLVIYLILSLKTPADALVVDKLEPATTADHHGKIHSTKSVRFSITACCILIVAIDRFHFLISVLVYVCSSRDRRHHFPTLPDLQASIEDYLFQVKNYQARMQSIVPAFVSFGPLRRTRSSSVTGPVCVATSQAPPAVATRSRVPVTVPPSQEKPVKGVAVQSEKSMHQTSNPTEQYVPLSLTDAARALVQGGQYPEALRAFAEADKAASSPDSELLRSWACIEGSYGDPRVAKDLFVRAVKAASLSHQEAAAWNAWALMEQRMGNFGKARKCFANGLKVDPAHVPLLQAFAIFEARFGSKDRARQCFAKAAEISEGHRAWLAWASFEDSEGHIGRARLLFKTATEKAQLNQAGPGAALAFARFEQQHKNMDKSRDIYRQLVIEYQKACGKVLHAWGTAESRAGDYLRSRQLFRASLLCDDMVGSNAAPAFQAWALAEKKAGNMEGARKLFKRGSEVDPKHAYVWQAWGILEQHCGRLDVARSIFERGLDASPRSAPTMNAWARLEASEGNIEKARELYRQATIADPNHVQSWQAWAVLEGRAGKLDAARMLFRTILDRNPLSAQAWQAWACLEHNAGNVETARSLFQRGVNADPNHSALWHAWSDMEAKLGEWKQGPACTLSQL